MIPRQSRYAEDGVELHTVPDRMGEPTQAIYPPHWYGREFSALKHTIVKGERLDQLAYKYYQDSGSWWVIAIANPEILYPDRIPGGTEVRIPRANPLR